MNKKTGRVRKIEFYNADCPNCGNSEDVTDDVVFCDGTKTCERCGSIYKIEDSKSGPISVLVNYMINPEIERIIK